MLVSILNLAFSISILISQSYQNSHIFIVLIFASSLLWTVFWSLIDQITQRSFTFFILPSLALSIFCQPFWENDFYRYFVDGIHALSQQPIYSLPPSMSLLKNDFKEVWDQLDYQSYKSIYPPVAIRYFQALTFLSFKKSMIFFFLLKLTSLITSLVMFNLFFKFCKKNKTWMKAVMLTFHPLLILEWHVNLHYDYLLTACFIFFISYQTFTSQWGSILIGVAIKYTASPLILFSNFRYPLNKKNALQLTGICFFLILLFPSLQETQAMFTNLLTFGKEWEMNSGIFRIFYSISYYLFPTGKTISISYLLSGGSLLLIFIWIRFYQDFLERELQVWLFFHLFILFSPVVNPWYFTWILPLLYGKQTNLWLQLTPIPLFMSYYFYLTEDYIFWFNLEHGLIFLFTFIGLWKLARDKKAKQLP